MPDSSDVALAQGWNGSSWAAQPIVNPSGDTTVVLEGVSCTAANACIAVGYHYGSYSQTLAEQWDGTSWTVMSTANFSSTTSNWLDSVSCTAANACMAAGYYYNSGYLTLTEQWNGSSWTLLTTPTPSNADSYLTGVSCSAATACTAVGYYTNYGSNYQTAWETLAERWNGTSWTQQLPPNPSNGRANDLNSVSCPASNSCTAVGSDTTTGTLAEVWNGSSWSVQTTPNASNAANYLDGVSCTATSACTAVGRYYVNNQQGPELTLAERWNGSSWAIQSTPNPSGSPSSELWGVSCATASACAAVGRYYMPNSGNLAFAEQWNGSTWTGQYLQQPLSGGPITSSESPASNFCFPCFIRTLAASMFVGDPVNPEFGDLTESATDIAIPGRGIPLAFTRTYDSLSAATNGPLGFGWTSNFFMSLSQPGGSGPVTIRQEGGAQAVFNPNGSAYAPAAPRDIASLTHNGDGSWTFTRLAQNTYTFSSTGQLLSETDLNGYTTTLSYTSGQLTTITEPAGRTLTIGWTGGNITSVTDPNVSPARPVGYQYDGSGQLTDVIDVNGGHTHYGYDPAHHLTNLYDPNCYAAGNLCNAGNGVVIGYNASNQVSSQQDQLGRQTTFTYSGDPTSSAGGSTTITDPKLNVTVNSYQDGVRIQETKGYGTSKAASWSWTYDPTTGAPITATDPDGHTTTSSVDASGNVLTTNDPMGRQTSATYNNLNEPLTKVDGNGVTTTYTYDTHGNLQTVSTPLVGTTQTKLTTYNYTDSSHPGDVTAMIDPDTNTWNYSYDGYGDRMTVTDPLSHVATTCYNADGWTLASYTPKAGSITCSNPPPSSPYETTYSYVQLSNGQTDQFGDVQGVTDPLGHMVAHTYDADRNIASTTDANGNPTTYVFDLANEQTDVRRADGTILHTDYNADGTVLDQKDGKGNAIQTYGYDPLGRETTVADTLGNTTTYAYDGAGNRLTQQDPGGNCGGAPPTGCTTMGYDADNELASVTYSDGVTPNVSNITYDKDGQRTGLTDGTGSSSWAWDSLRRLTSFADGRGDTVQYQYNLRGLISQITYPGGVNVTRGYDIAGRWTSVADWIGNSFTLGYDANGNLTSRTLPSATGEVDGSTYNAADQLTAISDTQGPSTLFAAGYGRDANGQVSSDSSLPSAVGSYRYTQLNQLCYAGSSNSSACTAPPTGGQPYSLDAADNLTGNNGTTQAFNTADELCWSVPGSSGNACGSAPTGATTFGYNNRGDRTAVMPPTGSAASLGYDQANRLTSYAQGSTRATYKYNGDGLRMSKTVGGVTTPFTWDVSGMPLLISDGTYDYVYGPGGVVVEEFLAPSISIVGTVAASGKATSLRLTLPSGVQVNDEVIVASTQPSTTTVTAPSGYTQVATVTSGGTSPLAKTTVFRHAVVTGDSSVTLTYNTGTTAQSVVLGVYRGVDPNQPIDVTATASAAASTSVTAPSVTPTYSSDRLLVFQGAVGTFSGSSWTAPTGTVERAQINATANVSSGLADQPIPLGATGSRSSVFGSSANLTAIEVTLAPVHTVILIGTATASGKTTSLALTLPTGVQVNDQVILASTQPSTTTVTAPSGYTQVATVTSGGSAPLATTTVFRHAVVSGDSSVTLTYSTSSTAQAVTLAAYRNVNPSQPIDVTGTGSAAASTTVIGPSVTTANSNDQLLVFQGAVGTFSGSSWTAPSGTTERAQINATANASTGLADQIVSAAGATGTRTSTFGRTANLTSVMVALAQPPPLPAIFFLHQDQLGSTRMLTDGAGVIKGTFTYDPYGNLTASTGSAATPFGFSGQYRDAETGFVYLRARSYDPATGQFVSSDPAVALTLQPYAYVQGNPVNHTDPSGLYNCGLQVWNCITNPVTNWSQARQNFVDNFSNGGWIAVGVPLAAAGGIAAAGLIISGVGAVGTVGTAARVAGPLGGVYTSKVLSQMENGDYHGFPMLMDQLVQESDATTAEGADGQIYTHINLPGCIRGVQGIFQWIMDEAGQINHRFFEPMK